MTREKLSVVLREAGRLASAGEDRPCADAFESLARAVASSPAKNAKELVAALTAAKEAGR